MQAGTHTNNSHKRPRIALSTLGLHSTTHLADLLVLKGVQARASSPGKLRLSHDSGRKYARGHQTPVFD